MAPQAEPRNSPWTSRRKNGAAPISARRASVKTPISRSFSKTAPSWMRISKSVPGPCLIRFLRTRRKPNYERPQGIPSYGDISGPGYEPHRGQRRDRQNLRHHGPVRPADSGGEPVGARDPGGDVHRRGDGRTAPPHSADTGRRAPSFRIGFERHSFSAGPGGPAFRGSQGNGSAAPKRLVRLRRGPNFHHSRFLPADAQGPGI